ncbi:MAG: DUF2520 domain-containing protein [Alphaproteobacteria bacterium]|nr:DUF2520 domain-containing protein [Alphaproteobacteria bacterium]
MSLSSSSSYLIVGSGRVATHIQHYLSLKNIPFLSWNRREYSDDDLDETLPRVSTVLLLIKDCAIEPFYEAHLRSFKGTIVHFSGTHCFEKIEGFHPLMTFGPTLYSLEFYEKIYFAGASAERFHAVFPGLPNPVFVLDDTAKPLYHALCVMSGNFPQILWRDCLASFENLGVPSAAVSLYLQKNLENFIAHPAQSLTGPLARGDMETVRKNIEALPDHLKPLYHAFVDFYMPSLRTR